MRKYTDQYCLFNIPGKNEASSFDIDGRINPVFTDKFDIQCLLSSILWAFLGFFDQNLLQSTVQKGKKTHQNFFY